MRCSWSGRMRPLRKGRAAAWLPGWVLAGLVGGTLPAAAEDLAAKFPNLVMPPIADTVIDEPVDPPAAEREPAVVRRPGFDLADRFPGIVMPPVLAATVVEPPAAAQPPVRVPGYSDFATIVEEAKREAMGLPALHARSVAGTLPASTAEKTPARFAAHVKQDRGGNPVPRPATPPVPTAAAPKVPAAPPARAMPGTQPPAASASGGIAADAKPSANGLSADSAAPQPENPQSGSPEAAVVPLPQLPAQAAVPDLRQELNRQIARTDLGGLRENWADAPNIVGDGCAPQGSSGSLAVGRICIIAPGLTGTPLENTGNAATLNVLTQGQFNTVQAIKAAGYPGFTLPATGLGSVPGTPPTTVPGGPAPAAGITGVGSPATFTAAANNTFATSPALNTSQYANLNPRTVFDSANSGALPNPAGSSTQDAFLFYNYVVDANIVLPGYAVGFVKLTENQSPIPRDRVYMTYSYFSNANFYPTKADVNRFMPGFEKTFFDGWTSVEIRTPFAATLSNGATITPGGSGVQEYRDIQFGNMSVIFKTLVWEDKTWAFTTGMQVMVPTANNTFVNSVNALGEPIQNVYVANESVHLMPFIGGIWAPNERWFSQGLLQVETDVNGNLAYVNNNFQTGIAGRELTPVGRIRYPNFMYISLGTGYWLYKDNTQNFTGFAPVMEVHVNQGLSAYCPIDAYGYQLGPNLGQVSVTNGLVGCNFEWGERSTLTFAYVMPLGGGVDRFFDGELRALYNWRFGPQNRLTRAQF